MEGSKSVIAFGYGYPPLEVKKNVRRNGERKNGAFSADRSITYTMGRRFLSLNITEKGCAGRANAVLLSLEERNGRGSSAYINLLVIRDERYGILYNINNSLRGSFDSHKENYYVPPLPDTEIICYACPETGAGSFFSVARKKSNIEFVDKVKATHAFLINDELTLNVSIKIINDIMAGLCVEVEGPLKLTLDYTKHFISSIGGKMESQMEARMRFLSKFATNGNDREIDDSNSGNNGTVRIFEKVHMLPKTSTIYRT